MCLTILWFIILFLISHRTRQRWQSFVFSNNEVIRDEIWDFILKIDLVGILISKTTPKSALWQVWENPKICLCMSMWSSSCATCDMITHWGQVTPIRVGNLARNWFNLVKFQWNLNRNPYIFIHENAFENVVCKMWAFFRGLNVIKMP